MELFDLEVKGYKAPNFEFLIKDAALLLPVSGTSMSRLDLTRRLPSGEAEKTQKAIQQYLVLRELKYRRKYSYNFNLIDDKRYAILHKKDDTLEKIKQHTPTLSVHPRDPFTLESTADCIVIPFWGTGLPKKRPKISIQQFVFIIYIYYYFCSISKK